MEFEFGGKTLERSKITIEQLESVLLQVACSLAVAELELEFEHRDLHCDNVLVNTTQQEVIEFVLHGQKIRVRTAGVKASVIDYTLSRTRIGGQVYYTDLSRDSVLFQGTGSYQYDIYRIMKEQNGDDWEAYRPHTNVVWLHYLLKKLFQKLPKTKQVADVIEPSTSRGRLAAWMDVILSFPSAEGFVAEQVIPLLERDAEAPRRAKCARQPQTEDPRAINLRARR
ncbi:serine/threonine-protein kinase haspin-like [Dermacentor silvarum]|uniref:serine/threonine-protein kinase haspin-like n=1 Tax=Dermacentor silvarum TaxID=543639 RepID=UPI0018998929|nr:serine/threonine-protein kinase haspin-like [Dermacentor silvarum]